MILSLNSNHRIPRGSASGIGDSIFVKKNDHIHKSHNKSLLLYYFELPIKYRRDVLSDDVSGTFRSVYLGIEERYEVHFLEIGMGIKHICGFNMSQHAPRKRQCLI